jgi:hypothetical protein
MRGARSRWILSNADAFNKTYDSQFDGSSSRSSRLRHQPPGFAQRRCRSGRPSHGTHSQVPIDDYGGPIDYFEKRLSATSVPLPLYQDLFSNGLGGLLLRAGRLDGAIARVNKGIVAAKEIDIPSDWAYPAVAHARKWGFSEAHGFLECLPALPPVHRGHSGTSRSLPSSGARLFKNSAMPRFRLIRFRTLRHDEPPRCETPLERLRAENRPSPPSTRRWSR